MSSFLSLPCLKSDDDADGLDWWLIPLSLLTILLNKLFVCFLWPFDTTSGGVNYLFSSFNDVENDELVVAVEAELFE